MKRILSIFLSLVLTAALLSPAAAAANETDGKDSDWLYITLDPGHGGNGAGGNDPGAISSTYGYHEADLVLKIGLYLKQELETYRNVHVDMTRSDSYGTSATAPLSKVENRVLFAAGQHSDLLVSLHLNSSPSQSARGAEVLVSNGNYRPEIAKVLDGVAGNILAQLKNLGIYNRGLVKKSSQDNTLYPNGKLADYYGIVRYGVENNVPSMIVEHCFISSNSECEQSCRVTPSSGPSRRRTRAASRPIMVFRRKPPARSMSSRRSMTAAITGPRRPLRPRRAPAGSTA